MKKCHLTDSVDPGNIQTIEQLWESIKFFTDNRCLDNQLCKESYDGIYPLETRMMQMATLHALVDAIDHFHTIHEIPTKE